MSNRDVHMMQAVAIGINVLENLGVLIKLALRLGPSNSTSTHMLSTTHTLPKGNFTSKVVLLVTAANYEIEMLTNRMDMRITV